MMNTNPKLASQQEWATAYFELVDDANQLAIQLLNLLKMLKGVYVSEDEHFYWEGLDYDEFINNIAVATKHLREYIGKYHDV